MKKIILLIVVTSVFSCRSSSDKPVGDSFTIDTGSGYVNRQPAGPTAFNNRDSSLESNAANEKISARRLLYMGIDSTYYAIARIEEIKNDLSKEAAVKFTTTERNSRSKALLRLNMIENVLCRQVDSALLINLKVHTAQLENINLKMIANSDRLQELSEKLARAAKVVDRLTSLLTVCISRGIVKPPTPATLTPAEVKATTEI